MVKCIDCNFFTPNPNYDYITNPNVSICTCEVESDYYPGDIQSLGFEEETPCTDFEPRY